MDDATVPSPRYAVNCSILFTELPLLERPAAAKAAGFDAVELWWPLSPRFPTMQTWNCSNERSGTQVSSSSG